MSTSASPTTRTSSMASLPGFARILPTSLGAAAVVGTRHDGSVSTAAGPQPPPPTPPSTPGAGGATPDQTQEHAPPPARRRRGTWADLVRTMLVVLAFVALIVLLVPRPGQLPRPAADVSSSAAEVESQLGFRPIVPAGLPAGWMPTEARTRDTADGVSSFRIGYITAGGLYASVDQAASITKDWLKANEAGGSPVGEVTIDGVTWEQRYQQDTQY